MRQKLSVIIPCKNERKNIRPCVLSAQRVADEVLVADSGSTDGTLDIVDQVGGCRVVKREYINSGNFKNWAIPQATYPWVLIVDADERVTPQLAAEINALLEVDPPRDGYHVYRRNYFLGHHIRHGGWGSDKVLRLFRRDLGRYQGESDHAEVHVGSRNVGYLKARLEHSPIGASISTFKSCSDTPCKVPRAGTRRASGPASCECCSRHRCASCTATSCGWVSSTASPAWKSACSPASRPS